MSSGPGEASGACGLDLNCDTVAFLDNHEAGMEDGLEDAPVSTSGEFLDKERGETMDVGGDENKECESGVPEDGMMGNAEESVASELGGRSEVDVVGIVIVEAGAESHGGKVLDVEFEEKGNAELVSVSKVDFEEVVGSSQATNLGSGGDQKRGADVDMKGVMGTDKISVSVLVGDGGTEDERLEGSSILRREQAEVQVDEGVELLDGQLDLEEREPEGESINIKLIEVDTGEKEIIDLIIVSTENFEAVDASNQAVSLGNVSGGDQKQGINVVAEGMAIDRQVDPGEKDAEVVSHSGKFLEEKEEDGSAELAVVSTEGFEPFEASIHTVDFHDGPGGDQMRRTDLDSELDLGEKGSAELVAVSNVGVEAVEASGHAMYLGDGFEDDRDRFTDVDKEEMVRTDEDFLASLVCGREAEDERLKVSSNMREEQVEVDLVDEDVQVLDDQSGPEEKEAKGDSLCIKLLEMDTVGAESADLIAVSAEEFKVDEASYQAAMEIGTGGSESANLVAVSAEEFQAVESINQAVNLGDGSGGDQKQGIDLDDEGMVIDGQLGPGERDAEVMSVSQKFLEVEKEDEGNAVLVSVSNEESRSVEAGRHPMDLHDESGGDQKQVTDLDEEGMIIDGELGSGKSQAEVETMEGKLLEMDRGEKEGTVPAAVSTECFEHAKFCSQAIALSDGSGDDHRLRPGLNAESTVGINEDSVAVLVGSGRKLLEADCRDKRSAEMVAVSPEVHEPVKASDQAINLVHRSGDDQSLLIDVVVEGMEGINEDSVAISVANVAPEDERSEVSLVLRDEQVEVRGDLDDGRGQAVEDELDTGKGEDEFKSYSGSCMEVDMGKKGITMLVGASAELSEAVEASSEAMILADGSGGDQKRGGDVDTEGLMGTDEVSVTVLVGGGGDNEKIEGSSILRSEHLEIQLDLIDESDHAVGAQLGCVESKAEVNFHESMLLELHSEEKESADLVAASAEEFDAIEVSDQAMNFGVGSCGVQMQRVDADAKGMDIDVQLSPGERDAEVESRSRKLLEVDKREEGSAEPVAVSSEVFEPVETSSQVMDFGDGSDGDRKRGTDVNVEGVPMDTELSPGKSVAKVEFHGEKFLEVDRDNERSTELPAVSTEGWFLPGEAGSEPMNFVDGCGDDQRLETDVDTESIVGTDEDSVAISFGSGAPEDARLEGSLILRRDHVEVQDNLVDEISEVVEGELGNAISVAEVKLYGEKHMEVDMVENGSTKLVASSTEWSDAVVASNQAMELENGSGSDQIQETDADAEGMVRNEDSVTVLVVGGVPGNESSEGSLSSGTEQVEILVHFADGCGQVENELESHGGKLLADKRKELIAASAERFEAVEASCQAMDLGDRSGGDQMQGIDVNVQDMVDISDDCAVVSADGCGQVVDSELIHRERIPIVESHGGKLLKVETGVKGGAEAFVISSEGFEAVEACSRAMDLEHGSGGDQKQGTDLDAEDVVEIGGDSANVSGADGGPEDESSEKSLLLGKEHNEVLRDLVDGHDQVLDGEFGLVKRGAEVEPYSEKLLELDVREKGSAELASVPAGATGTVEASSQDVDFEVGYSSEQKQESNVGAACMVKTDEDSVVVSVDGGGPEDEMLNRSVKEVEVGEETHGIGSTVKDLPESTKNESAGYDDDTLIHAAQIQTEFDGCQRQDADVGAETVVGGTEQAYKFGGKQVDVGEDNIGPEMLEKKSANPEEIGGCEVDLMKNTGHVNDPVHSKHVEDLESRDEFGGDHRTESCMETDADTFVVAVASQGDDGSDKSQMVEKVAHFQRSGDTVNVDVCDLVEGHPDERGGEIISDNGHNPSEVNSEFSAGEENMIEKGSACPPESAEAVHDFMDHPLDEQDPGSGGHDQKALVTNEKQGISSESFQVSELELMEVETGIVDRSTVSPERAEVLTQASSIENGLKISDEKSTSAAETVRRLNSIPIIEEEGTDSQREAGDMKNSVVRVSIDVAKPAKTLEAAFNMEPWSSDEHTAVDNMAEEGNVLSEDNGSVTSVTPAELQNGDARLNFDLDTAGSHSLGNFFKEKAYSIMEDSNSLLGISMPESSPELVNLTITSQWNEPSVGFQEARPPNFPSRKQEESVPEQGAPALESALDAVDETIDFSQKLLNAENQSEGCDDTRTESASTGERAMYYLSFPEREVFSTSDLVWGKVKSHPWWPGQIFDLSGASQLAIKYQKKDHFLVAYFGDKTFAWCEEARLKPFQSCFSQMDKQTSSDSFLRALHDILVEISRRVGLSMACSCLPEETYADVKYQKVENAGVRGKIVNSVFDRGEIVNYFHPDQLLEYVKSLALLPTGGADRLELTVARAQLKAFYLSKGYTELPAFTIGSGLVENDFETPSSTSKKPNEDDLEHSATLSNLFSTKGKLRSRDGSLGKQKEIVEDGRKQKSLSELMEEDTNFPSEVQEDENCWSSGNKRKALDYVSSDIGRSKTKKVDFQEDEETKLPSPTSNSSFKVGAFISRAASKLTSGQPIRKCTGETSERCLSKTDDWSVDYMDIDDFLDVNFDYPKLQIDISEDYPPTKEMLSKLCLAARNPLKGYNFSSIVINFFCTFRNVQVSNISIEKHKAEKPRAKRGRKKKIISDLESPDMSTPDHMKDSYWSDMVIPEKDAKRRGRKKRKFIDESPPSLMLNSPPDCDPKLHAGATCPHVKTAERPIISVEEKIVDERTPTAVILYFNGSNSLPSDTDLIRIFSRYGPLKEEETYIETKNNSAMVVFKKRTDAEMAFSSAGKFSTFGPALLSYRLRHFPFESSPVNTLIGEDDAMPTEDGHLGILAEPEFNGALDRKLCEDLDKESSIFVQSQEHFRSASDIPPGNFSELAPYQDGDIVISDSAPANTGSKEPLQDVPAQMATGAGSDHLLLESLDPEFSYFDLDQAVDGDISGAELEVENSSGLLLEAPEISHAANDRSSGEECSDSPPVPVGAETSSSVTMDAQLMEADLCAAEQREVITASDSTQVELAARSLHQ